MKQPIPNLVPRYIDDAAPFIPLLPVQARELAHFYLFEHHARRAIASQGYGQFDVIHHLTWGTVNWGSSFTGLGVPLVWGPLGGGQATPRFLRPAFGRAWWWESVRNLVVRHVIPSHPAVRRAVKNAALIYAENSETARLVQRLGSRQVVPMLAEGVNALHERKTETDSPTVLWVGRLIPRKGAILAVHAFANMLKKVPDARLVMVGTGPQENEVRAAARIAGIASQVEFVGWVPRQDVDAYYETATVFLFTSLRDSFGTPLVEAASYGLPIVILSHQSAARMIPDDAAVRVPSAPSYGLAARLGNTLAALATDIEKQSRLSAAAMSFASVNTWQYHVQVATEHYYQLCNAARN